MTVLKAFRLQSALVNRLARLAKASHRSETFYIEQALTHYLEDYADAQIAKDRFADPKSTIVSAKELRNRLGL